MVFFLCYQIPAYSGVYKWVDDSGQIHYSDQPDEPGAEKFTLRKNTTTKPGIENSDETTEGKSQGPESETEKSEDETKPAEPKMVEIEPSKQEKKRFCNQAKKDIASISSRGRMREINEKGEYIYLSEEQRQQRLSSAKKQKREFCR
jgi:hypothetical protein